MVDEMKTRNYIVLVAMVSGLQLKVHLATLLTVGLVKPIR
jgi:hypothetical protein